MAKKDNAPSPAFVIGLAVVFVLISIYPLTVAWSSYRLMNASEPSTCELLDIGVEEYQDAEGSSRGYHPVVEIAHTVDGQRHVREDSGLRYISESDASAATKDLRIGQQVECRYVAGSPDQVVFLEQNPGQVRGMSIFAVLLWALPLGMFLWARTQPSWKRRRKEKRAKKNKKK